MTMNIWALTLLLALAVKLGTPLLLACLGEIYSERSGILNLGIEGIMMLGAAVGFAVAYETNSILLGFISAAIVGALLGLIHAFVTVDLRGNQIISGLAITFVGIGLATLIGHKYIGKPLRLRVPILRIFSDVPILSAFFTQDVVVYFAYLVSILLWFILFYTRIGIEIRATGESPIAAEASGVNITLIRYVCVMLSGLFAGIGGAYISLVSLQHWSDLITIGKGWIALALVIVSLWNPIYALIIAYLFGILYAFQVLLPENWGIDIHLAGILPYATTIVVLTFASKLKARIGTPILGKPYIREEEALHGV